MSSLLDVLHKRPPRSQLATAPADDGAPHEATAELRLAPEPDLALAPGTITLRGPAHPAADDATAELPSPRPGPAGGPADAAPAQPGARRWNDGHDGVAEPAATPARPTMAAPVPDAAARARGRRLVLAISACAVVVVVVAALAWQLSAPSQEEGFLVAPDGGMAASAEPGQPVEDVAAPAPPEAAPVAPPPRKTARPRPAAAREPAPAPAEVAWYDEPALPAAAEPAPAAEPVIRISRGSTVNPVYETVRGAYAALIAGDGARAELLYRDALAAEPTNVDALLGLGSLAVRGGRTEEARDLYRRVQQLDPRNGTAAAALSALPGAAAGAASESQLKTLIREQPASAALHFALGQRYVAEQRWPDAQAAFFEAVRHEPVNADYAFNLAVSLDRLGQSGPAASYYRRALELATGSQRFDVAAASARLSALGATGG